MSRTYTAIHVGSGSLHPSPGHGPRRTDGPADAIAHGYLFDGPVALFASDASNGEPTLRCEGLMLSLLGTADPAGSSTSTA